MTTRLKFTGRYQILENNQATTDPINLNYTISNVVDLHNGTYFSLDPGQSVEFSLSMQANCILVTSDNPVTVATDTNSESGVSNFTVDTATDLLFTARDVFPVTAQAVTLTTTGTLPAPLAVGTTYYAISMDTNELMLAASAADAKSGTEIDITDTGLGVHTLDLASSYTQCIDDYTQSTISLFTGANAQRVTIKNNNGVRATGKFYAARTSA
jgi:small-conductance mechanosensitive channel